MKLETSIDEYVERCSGNSRYDDDQTAWALLEQAMWDTAKLPINRNKKYRQTTVNRNSSISALYDALVVRQ
jgi:hypothetical protein